MSWVLFFDGDCGLCSGAVRQVARWDKNGRIAFAPLQGELSHQKGFARFLNEGGGTMVLLREADGQIFTCSDALIELARVFGGWWCVFTAARIIPKLLRDRLYGWVAAHRYRFAGKSDTCSLPDPSVTKRLRR